MCFSAEADVVAAVVVGGIGVDALRHVRHRREVLLGALPMVFAVHLRQAHRQERRIGAPEPRRAR